MTDARRRGTVRQKQTPATRSAPPRARLIHDVERQWCALSSAMAHFQTRSAAQRGLTLRDLQAVDILAREDAVCAGELAEECGLTRGAITGMLDRLERAGVATVSRAEDDGRRLVIRGVESRRGGDCRVPEAFRQVAQSFDDHDLESIRPFLSQSAEALRRDAESLRGDA